MWWQKGEGKGIFLCYKEVMGKMSERCTYTVRRCPLCVPRSWFKSLSRLCATFRTLGEMFVCLSVCSSVHPLFARGWRRRGPDTSNVAAVAKGGRKRMAAKTNEGGGSPKVFGQMDGMQKGSLLARFERLKRESKNTFLRSLTKSGTFPELLLVHSAFLHF